MPANGAAISSAGATGCALHGASLSLVCGTPPVPSKSNQREGAPCIRVWPLHDQTSLTPALLRGHVTKGHPCPFVPRSASMPRVPLHNACVRPPEGEGSPSCLKDRKPASLCFSMHTPTGDITLPLADGRVEPARRGASGMDAARGLGVPAIKGQGWPLYAGPRSAGGRRGVRGRSSRTRMKGRAFFCLLFFAPGGDPRAKKSEAPFQAQPVARAEESATSATSVRATPGGKRSAVFHPTASSATGKSEAPYKAHPVAAVEPSQPLTSTTTPSTPADSPLAAAAPPHWPARCSGRYRSAAARTAPGRHASRRAVGRRPCRNPPR